MLKTDFLDKSSMRQGNIDITDYTDAQFRAFIDNANHTQPGDPSQLAVKLIALTDRTLPSVSYLVLIRLNGLAFSLLGPFVTLSDHPLLNQDHENCPAVPLP